MENEVNNNNAEGSQVAKVDTQHVREPLVKTAVQFLQNPNIATSPLDLKVAFLKKKGLTEEEVSVALKRSGIKPASETSSQQLQTYNGHVSIPIQNHQLYQTDRVSKQTHLLLWIRDLANAVIVIGGFGYAIYWLYKKYIEPFIFGFGRKGKKKSLETRISELDENIKDVKKDAIESIERLGKNIDQSVEIKMEIVCQRYLHDIQELTSQVTSLKGLLLNRKQFPPTPATAAPSIPSWQLQEVQNSEATNSGEDAKEDGQFSFTSEGNTTNGNGSDDSSLEMIKDEK